MKEVAIKDVVLYDIFAGLQKLKRAGYHVPDGRLLWCSGEVLHGGNQSAVTDESSIAARSMLSRLKSASKALSNISKSLEDAIQSIADRYSPSFREYGLKSLPDDVLALIFEFHYEASVNKAFTPTKTISSSIVLASVCKRFRQIALRIPALWDEVGDTHGNRWISNLKQRTRHPSVHIRRFRSQIRPLADFIQLLHPIKQWKALNVRYSLEMDSHSLFKYISSELHGEFLNLKTLILAYETRTTVVTGVDAHPIDLSAMISEEDDNMLGSWELARLERLVLKNVIPKSLLCWGLKELDLTLEQPNPFFQWDLYALKLLVNFLDSLASISITLSGVRWASLSAEVDAEPPAELMGLTSFTLKVLRSTDPAFVKHLMDIWDAPILSNLTISLQCNEASDADAWLDAIFKSSNSSSLIRTFPNVKAFSLSVEDVPRCPPYETMLRALPRVRDLSFELPGRKEPEFEKLMTSYGCLQDLQSLHLKTCSSMDGTATMRFMTKLEAEGNLKGINAVEVEGCYGFIERKEALQKVLGDKLVWKG